MFRFYYSVFLLFFFAKAQSDVVTYLWSMLLSRPAQHFPWLNAIALTGFFCLLAGWGARFLAARGRNIAWSYLAVSILVVIFVSFPFASVFWWIMMGTVTLFLAACLYACNRVFGAGSRGRGMRYRENIGALMRLIPLCLYMGTGAAATDEVHYELRTAQALRSDHPEKAYEVGSVSLAASPRLFAMRCYLMATTGKQGLGADIFKQPVPAGGSARLLFPSDDRQLLLFPPAELYRLLGTRPRSGETAVAYLRRCAYLERSLKKKTAARPAADYYLCALLLDRQLDLFAREIVHFYPLEIQRRTLPFYFAQALVYYNRMRTRSVCEYRDEAIEANRRDYCEMEDTLSSRRERYNLLRRSYGETYWWWYEYGEK